MLASDARASMVAKAGDDPRSAGADAEHVSWVERGAGRLLLVAGLVCGMLLRGVGFAAQAAYLAAHERMADDAQAVLQWTPARYGEWRGDVLVRVWLSLGSLLLVVLGVAWMIATRAPGRLWLRVEALAAQRGLSKGAVYAIAGLIAAAAQCCLTVSALDVGVVAWLLAALVPNMVLVVLRMHFKRGVAAPMLAVAMFGAAALAAGSLSPLVLRASALGPIEAVPSVPAAALDGVRRLVDDAGFGIERVYVVRDIPGAYAGSALGSVLVLGEGDLRGPCLACVLGVAAHELGHWADGRMWLRFAGAALGASVRAALPWGIERAGWLLRASGAGACGARHGFGLAVVLAPFVFSALYYVFSPLLLALSRREEVSADGYACRLGQAGGLARFFREAAYDSPVHAAAPLFVGLVSTHPCSVDRVRDAELCAVSSAAV